MADSVEKILQIRDLDISFCSQTETIHAIRGVDLVLRRGETVALVGESGSGKSVSMKAAMGILPANARINSGSILYNYKTPGGGRELGNVLFEYKPDESLLIRLSRDSFVVVSMTAREKAVKLLQKHVLKSCEERMGGKRVGSKSVVRGNEETLSEFSQRVMECTDAL